MFTKIKMPLPVKEVKELTEEECYIRRDPFAISTIACNFLQKKPDTAYTGREISKEMQANSSDASQKFNSSTISTQLTRLAKSQLSKIQKKGLYFWYEE